MVISLQLLSGEVCGVLCLFRYPRSSTDSLPRPGKARHRGVPGGRPPDKYCGLRRSCPKDSEHGYPSRPRSGAAAAEPDPVFHREPPPADTSADPASRAARSAEFLQALEHFPEPFNVMLWPAHIVQALLVELLTVCGRPGAERVAKWGPCVPGLHRGLLDQRVGVLPAQPRADQ